ncbi:uncharacterized protein AB9X84_012359 isoform 1-T1 [Acanthopagrus schlegelii]
MKTRGRMRCKAERSSTRKPVLAQSKTPCLGQESSFLCHLSDIRKKAKTNNQRRCEPYCNHHKIKFPTLSLMLHQSQSLSLSGSNGILSVECGEDWPWEVISASWL